MLSKASSFIKSCLLNSARFSTMAPGPFHINLLSDRAQKGLKYPSTGPQNLAHSNDPFHPESNKQGIIKLSSADSILCEEITREKFNSIDWSKFDAQNLFVYPRGGGEISTLKCMADFINRYCRRNQPPLTWETVILVPGVTTCADLLGQILFDPGEILLVPSPYYYRFANDFGERGLVEIVTIHTLADGQTRPELKVEKFEEAYQSAIKQGKKVRAITLVNPQNPEGCYFSLEEIKPIVEWALKYKIFVILDEIYDLTIYDEHPDYPFQGACSLFEGDASNFLIWIWGISKNFSLPGLRFAVLHSPNETIRIAAQRFVMHHLPNTCTQFIARQFLSDYDWIDNVFIPENHKRLKAARNHFLSLLDSKKLAYIKPRSGFFVLIDFSKYLDEPTFEAERRLYTRFFENRVLITAGETMYCYKPGWFRIVFTSVHQNTVAEAFERIVKTLETQTTSTTNK